MEAMMSRTHLLISLLAQPLLEVRLLDKMTNCGRREEVGRTGQSKANTNSRQHDDMPT